MSVPESITLKSDRLPQGQMHCIPICRTLEMLKSD